MRGHPAVGDRPAHAELGALAEALLAGVVGDDLGVRLAVLNQGGEFEQREHIGRCRRRSPGALSRLMTTKDSASGSPKKPCLRQSLPRQVTRDSRSQPPTQAATTPAAATPSTLLRSHPWAARYANPGRVRGPAGTSGAA